MAAVVVAAWPSASSAQSANEAVEALNRDAMEAYNNLDIEKAGSMLEEALRVAYQSGLTGPLVARTNLNLGVVIIGGLGDNDSGLAYFVQALCNDPSIQLDPLTSTPDIQSVFMVAQQQTAAGACQGSGPAGPIGPTVPVQQPIPPPDQAVLHYPPAEQLTQTPLPLYIEVNPLVRPKRAFLSYKGLGMDSFKRVPMYVYQQGFAYQISCKDVWEPKVSYFIQVENEDGDIVGVSGSAATPFEVPVVAQRTQAEPALPGASAPMTCGAGECPPGVKGCKKLGMLAIGESCDSDKECQSGLECSSGECALIGNLGTEGPDYEAGEDWSSIEGPEIDDPKAFRRMYFQLGLSLGLTFVQSGMLADRPSPDNRVFVDEFGNYVEDPLSFVASGEPVRFPEPGGPTEPKLTSWVPDANSADSIGPLNGSCSADDTASGPEEFINTGDPDALFPSKYCVRVKSAGFVPGPALRVNAGYFLSEKLALGLLGRLQFAAGEGSLAGILLGARGEYMLSDPSSQGLMISAIAGLTIGQIQAKPPAQGNTDDAPYVRSGMMGAHAGAAFRYRFTPSLGIVATPELDVQLPTFLINVDLTVAFEAAILPLGG